VKLGKLNRKGLFCTTCGGAPLVPAAFECKTALKGTVPSHASYLHSGNKPWDGFNSFPFFFWHASTPSIFNRGTCLQWSPQVYKTTSGWTSVAERGSHINKSTGTKPRIIFIRLRRLVLKCSSTANAKNDVITAQEPNQYRKQNNQRR